MGPVVASRRDDADSLSMPIDRLGISKMTGRGSHI